MKKIIFFSLLFGNQAFAMKPIAVMSAVTPVQKSVCTISATGNSKAPLNVKMEYFFEGDPAGKNETTVTNDYDLISLSRELKGTPCTEDLNEEERNQYIINALSQDDDGIITSTPVFGLGQRTIESSSPRAEEFVSTVEALCLSM